MDAQAARESAALPNRIHILPPEEARKIAAGEVIDRPAALVREFIDNAIDAGGSLVETFIDGGGVRRVEVADNGNGMGKEDVKLCWRAHATSKIRTMEDLNSAETLGFRGEALAAAAAVSRLEILSSVDGREAWRLETGPGDTMEPRLTQISRVKGTSVRSLNLFDAIPVRRRFLKREGSEAGLCKQIFLDKALAFPALTFRFVQDGCLKVFLPGASSFKERYAQALLDRNEGRFLHEISAGGQGFSVIIVAGGPELYRLDRRQQYVFANGRRIQDFSLIQALEYGLHGWFPNGAHPIGAVYLDVDPSRADFNIHPAKREARFRDAGSIHHTITTALHNFSRRRNIAVSVQSRVSEGNLSFAPEDGDLEKGPYWSYPGGQASGPAAMKTLLDKPPAFAPLPGRGWDQDAWLYEKAPSYGENVPPGAESGGKSSGARIVGRLFHLFILVEWKDRLFIIDQHAAHERILYDRLTGGPIPRQELLAPIPFSTESDEDDEFLTLRREELAKLGVIIVREDRDWTIEALPSGWRLPDAETVRSILDLRTAGENMAERWAATLACHGAIKDGDYLDDVSALALAKEALKLKIPRCPHGRPVWFELSRDDLFRAVRRR
ncbi:MAG: DNA mismatch repair endonuclease MutL [Spirochaetaceae bacterium]|jgi:DNA mismatch repair protein MutL|nr:DNA mismatch repair endonuclease MutL [Spirochaetaceae bacterium]